MKSLVVFDVVFSKFSDNSGTKFRLFFVIWGSLLFDRRPLRRDVPQKRKSFKNAVRVIKNEGFQVPRKNPQKMKNCPPKDLKIHGKSTLGCYLVDFLTPWGDFGGCRKIIDFLIALGVGQKREKWSRGAAKGGQRDFGSVAGRVQRSDAGAEGSLGRPRAGYSRIVI